MRSILLVLSFAAAGAVAAQAASASAGKTAYDQHCKGCHGPNGMANPAIAKMMKVEIPDLKSSAIQGMSDTQLENVIKNGKGKMKGMPSAAGSAADIVAYIRTLKK